MNLLYKEIKDFEKFYMYLIATRLIWRVFPFAFRNKLLKSIKNKC